MKNVKLLRFNAYATGDNGVNYRAVAMTENNETVWRLCKEVKIGLQWDFVNETRYTDAVNAINAIRMYELTK